MTVKICGMRIACLRSCIKSPIFLVVFCIMNVVTIYKLRQTQNVKCVRNTIRHLKTTLLAGLAEDSHGDVCQPLADRLPHAAPILPCTWRAHNLTCTHRYRAALQCDNPVPKIVPEKVPAGTPPIALAMNHSCLLRAVKQLCTKSGNLVPSIVHYIHFSGGKPHRELPLHTFLGLVSVLRFVHPCLLLFHADILPSGKHWEMFLQLTSRVIHVRRDAPASIFGHVIDRIEHKADVARLEAMLEFGGIYMDTDEVLLRPLDELMQHHVTLGWENPNKTFGNGLFLAEPNNSFIAAWYDKYRRFTNRWWSYFSTKVPHLLYNERKGRDIHVVDTFFQPDLFNITKLFYERNDYDWSSHYALHLYYRRNQRFFQGPFETKNSSLGQVSRHIFFGDKNKCT